MSSELSFVEFVVDQMRNAGIVAYRKMFGEYAIYCDDKVVGLICDNQLFVKATDRGREFIGDVVEAPAYPGAKMSFLIEDKFEDREWITSLIQITADALPAHEPKKKSTRKKKS